MTTYTRKTTEDILAFVKATDDDYDYDDETTARVYSYAEYVECFRSSWGGEKGSEEADALWDITGFKECGCGVWVVYDDETSGPMLLSVYDDAIGFFEREKERFYIVKMK